MRNKPKKSAQVNGLYVIKDRIADKCSAPFLAVNHDVARREFVNVLTQSNCPQDYELIHCGYISDCHLMPIDQCDVVMFGKETIKNEVNDE